MKLKVQCFKNLKTGYCLFFYTFNKLNIYIYIFIYYNIIRVDKWVINMGTAVGDGLSASEYSSLQSKISSLRSSVETAGSQMNSTAESSYNGLDSVKFGSWADDVASNLNNYCTAVKEGMREIGTDYAGGNFINLKLSLTDLETALGQCAKYASNIATQKNKYNSAKSEAKKARILELINAETRNLSTCVAFCNDRIAFAEGVVFTGTVTYTPGGVSGLEDTAALQAEIEGMGDNDPIDKQAAMDKFSEDLAQMEINDSMIVYDTDGTECLLVKHGDGALRITRNDGSDYCYGVFGGYDTLTRFTQYNPTEVE